MPCCNRKLLNCVILQVAHYFLRQHVFPTCLNFQSLKVPLQPLRVSAAVANSGHGALQVPGVVMPNNVTISGIELDEMIDGVNRGIGACTHAANFCRNAVTVFDQEAQHLREIKHMLSRFRRSY